MLQKIIKEKGYTTVAIDWLGRWHKRGFDYYIGDCWSSKTKIQRKIKVLDRRWWYHRVISKLPNFLVKAVQMLYHEIKGYEVTKYAIKYLKQFKNKKFFMLIHYWDTHTPYTHNPKWSRRYRKYYEEELEKTPVNLILEKIKNEDYKKYLKKLIKGSNYVEEIIRRYDEAVAFADKQVGEIIKFLEENRLFENTLIIITSDHGESLGEHDIYFSHHGLYDDVIRVPLIIAHSDLPQNIRIKGLIQHCDLVPTILNLLGIQLSLPLDGISSLPLIFDDKQIRNKVYVMGGYEWENGKIAVRTHEYKYIFTPPERLICKLCGYKHGDVHELYNIKEDPLELKNIYKDKVDIAEESRTKMHQFLKTLVINKQKYIIVRKIKRALSKPQN